MSIACVYTTPPDHARKIVKSLKIPRYNLTFDDPDLDVYGTILFITQSDDLPSEIDQFIETITDKKRFAICSLDQRGAVDQIRSRLMSKGWSEVKQPLHISCQSFNLNDWNHWKRELLDREAPFWRPLKPVL